MARPQGTRHRPKAKGNAPLQARLPMEKNFPIYKYNRIRTGGLVSYFSVVKSIEELLQAIFFSHDNNLPFYIIGSGTNVLINDLDFKGVVIKLSGKLREIEFDKTTVTCGAGTSLVKLGFELAQRGYSGYSYMAVIPGTVGGAVRINAGTTKHGEIKDHLISAIVFGPKTGTIDHLSKADMNFGYRTSNLLNSNMIIIQAKFHLSYENKMQPENVLSQIKDLQMVRKKKQPKNQRNFGSTFKRPNTQYAAGWYLEKVGMKGKTIGDAMVANEHANWIVNIGRARSEDVKKLITIGQKRVFDEYGIRLEREVIYLPEDMEHWK